MISLHEGVTDSCSSGRVSWVSKNVAYVSGPTNSKIPYLNATDTTDRVLFSCRVTSYKYVINYKDDILTDFTVGTTFEF